MQILTSKRIYSGFYIGIFFSISCNPISSNHPSNSTTTMSNDLAILSLRYSVLKIEMDAGGHLNFAKYEGKPIVIDATLTNVQLARKSPSISIENDVAFFSLDSVQSIPNSPKFRVIELTFDQYRIKNPNPFITGQKWRFTFSENGQLVSLEQL